MSYHQPSLRMKIKYNLPSIKSNKREKRIKYQNLYKSEFSFNKSRQKESQNDLSNDFFVRNYENYLSKINRRTKYYNSKLITEEELNSILYKLKSYFSEVVTINNKKEESLKSLKEELKYEQFKLNQVIEFQDIELPDEKISVKNFNELKLTKNEVEKILRNLLKEKQHLDELLKNAGEYFKTIEYMCEDEKNRFMEIKKETNIIEERINNVKQYQQIINYNLGKEKIKNEEEKKINIKLAQDIKLVENVNMNQKRKIENLDKIILEKETEIEELKNKLLEIKLQNKQENELYQNGIQQKIEKAKEYNEEQQKKEKNIIEIIYCLFLIQNYFIKEENFNRQNMESSIEYQLLANKNYNIDFLKKKEKNSTSPTHSEKNEGKVKEKYNMENDENEIVLKKLDEKLAKKMSLKNEKYPLIISENGEKKSPIIRPNSTKNKSHTDLIIFMKNKERKKDREENKNKDNEDSKISNNNEEKEKNSKNDNVIKTINTFNHGNKMIKSESSHSNNNSKKNNLEIPCLEELKEKFYSIKLNKEILFDYNSKLTSKLNFLKAQFDQFHNKELLLEEKKSISTKKAIQVISEDYLTFNQLTKIQPKIKEFFINNSEIIGEIQIKNKKNKLKIINHQIKQTNPVNSAKNLENSESIYQIDDQLNNNTNLIISSSEKIIRANKNFFIKCNDCLKQIINTIENINNLDKKENEKKKNNENENMSEFDLKDNKENKENEEKEEKSDTISESMIDKEFTKLFTEESEKLENLLKKMEESIPNDKKSLVNYVIDLIKYSQKDEKLKEIFDLEEINNDLLYLFYKDPERKKIKSTFYKQFQLKRFPELKEIFNHFTIFIEPTIENIQQIIKIINDAEKNSNLTKIINIKSNKFLKKFNFLSSKNISKNINIHQDSFSNENIDNINLRYISKLEKNKLDFDSGSSHKDTFYSELEFMGHGKIDEDDILDNEVEKKEKKIFRRKVNSIEENIVKKLYSPFLQKTSYLRKLNKNMKGIKSMTSYNCKANHTLRKRNGEIDVISNQMLIYNNPLINPDRLADPTYNSLVKLAISSRNEKKRDIRFKSTFTPREKYKKQL